ncbi:sirohydrochlorin chelatase [Nocardia ignorata]|uniref:Sirohydrochlorin ferrochelatase n=1 Tax=Nocardia ignorata TaxID=145285 RepID=A0A4V3CPN5_NOCIG|nr:sirohydrochlorin chelatase [Nocardia ignorata]TDP38692.1 sirohydrochlorin ferrochelatase [Nocardia ignorata]
MTRSLVPPRGAVPVPRGAGGPALIAVAHGSRDPRSATTMAAVVASVAASRPDLTVRLAFLDLSAPSLDQVVDELAALGHREVIVVPLLLGNAFHARVDLPALLAESADRHPLVRLTQTEVLGADSRLIAALADRVAGVSVGFPVPEPVSMHRPATPAVLPHESGRATVGVAVAAVGSRDESANRRTAAVARRLAMTTGLRTEMCFATVEPSINVAVDRLHARGVEQVIVAPWFLAPGLLTDRLLHHAPRLVHADVIGPHPALAEVIWSRYDAAIATDLELSA